MKARTWIKLPKPGVTLSSVQLGCICTYITYIDFVVELVLLSELHVFTGVWERRVAVACALCGSLWRSWRSSAWRCRWWESSDRPGWSCFTKKIHGDLYKAIYEPTDEDFEIRFNSLQQNYKLPINYIIYLARGELPPAFIGWHFHYNYLSWHIEGHFSF